MARILLSLSTKNVVGVEVYVLSRLALGDRRTSILGGRRENENGNGHLPVVSPALRVGSSVAGVAVTPCVGRRFRADF